MNEEHCTPCHSKPLGFNRMTSLRAFIKPSLCRISSHSRPGLSVLPRTRNLSNGSVANPMLRAASQRVPVPLHNSTTSRSRGKEVKALFCSTSWTLRPKRTSEQTPTITAEPGRLDPELLDSPAGPGRLDPELLDSPECFAFNIAAKRSTENLEGGAANSAWACQLVSFKTQHNMMYHVRPSASTAATAMQSTVVASTGVVATKGLKPYTWALFHTHFFTCSPRWRPGAAPR